MGNLNLWEIVLLVILAVIIFGPERLPDLARKAARVIHFVRNIANNAQDTVRRELGPEYADLQLADLQPKNLVKKVLAEDYETIEAEIRGASDAVREAGETVRTGATEARRAIATEVEETRELLEDRDDVAERVEQTTVVVAPTAAQRDIRYDTDAT